MPKALTPPDRARCQAMKPGNGPFTVGGVIGNPRDKYRVRCETPPTVIARETRPGADGRCGSMSLCDSCRDVLIAQCGEGFATFHSLTEDRG